MAKMRAGGKLKTSSNRFYAAANRGGKRKGKR